MNKEGHVDAVMTMSCSNCSNNPNCPLKRFEQEFNRSKRNQAALNRLAAKYNLTNTYYRESNDTPHFTCPEAAGVVTGRLTLIPTD